MKDQFKVVLSSQAEHGIEEAWQWIAQSDPWAADEWENGLLDEIEGLSLMPQRYPISPESRLGYFPGEMWQMLYGRGYWKYRVLFVIEEDAVIIVHIRHGARRFVGGDAPEDSDG